MRLFKSCDSSAWTIVLLSGLLLASAAMAGDSGRRYDSNNAFQGTYRVTESGAIRLYDESGRFEGKIIPTRDERGYRRYDSSNRFVGSIEDDESEE